MDVLLTHGYFLNEDVAERRVMKPYPPLGILYLSSYLKSKGFHARVFDTTFASRRDFDVFIEAERPGVVGFYVNLMTKKSVLELISFCKSRGCAVIVGGPDVPEYAEHYITHGADVAVLGEGEATLAELLPAMHARQPLAGISGIVFRSDDGRIVRTAGRALIENLDALPLPDRDSISMHKYIQTWKIHHGMGSVSLVCARGCPYTCTWCSRSVYGETHRRRSVKNVVDEIEVILASYRPDMLWFADDVFTASHPWFNEFYAEMKRRNLSIPFECISRADRLNEDVIRKMASLGAYRIWYGSESGSQRILDAMKRRVSVEQIRETTMLCRKHGIHTGLFVMLGYPGEEIEDIELTVDHLKQTNADSFLTTVAYPIKGTEFFDRVKSQIHDSANWSSGSDRNLDFSGRKSRSFYWFANRYVVNEVRRARPAAGGHYSLVQTASSYLKAKIARLGMEVTKRQSS